VTSPGGGLHASTTNVHHQVSHRAWKPPSERPPVLVVPPDPKWRDSGLPLFPEGQRRQRAATSISIPARRMIKRLVDGDLRCPCSAFPRWISTRRRQLNDSSTLRAAIGPVRCPRQSMVLVDDCIQAANVGDSDYSATSSAAARAANDRFSNPLLNVAQASAADITPLICWPAPAASSRHCVRPHGLAVEEAVGRESRADAADSRRIFGW